MITFEQLTNYVDDLQQRYIREHLIPANAVLMPRWAFEELKEKLKSLAEKKKRSLNFIVNEILEKNTRKRS